MNQLENSELLIDGKKIAVVGSREYGRYLDGRIIKYDHTPVWEFVGSLPGNCEIVSGGARGVDTAAKEAAKHHGFKYVEFPAEWNKYGKNAGFIRNAQIVAYSDIVVAFWDGRSTGTKDTIRHAERQGKSVFIFD